MVSPGCSRSSPPLRDRSARYVCLIVAIGPEGEDVAVEGTLAGTIAIEQRGERGLRLRPDLYPRGGAATVAELGDDWKAAHSHRALAAAALASALSAR